MNHMRKIAILTYQDRLEKYTNQLQTEFENTEVIQYGSDFSYEILTERAKMIEQLGYEAIIARGYTAALIKADVDIPVATAEPDLLDVLEAMIDYGIKERDPVTILFQNSNVLLKCEKLSSYIHSLFGVYPEIESYYDMKEYYDKINQVYMRDRILFSGHNGIQRAKEIGGRCAPLYVGENAIRTAVIEAIGLIDTRRKDAARNGKMEAVLSTRNEGIINIDEMCRVEWINDYARRVLGIPYNEDVSRIDLPAAIPGIRWEKVLSNEQTNVIVNTTASEDIIMDTKNVCGADGGREAFIFFRKTDSVVEEEKKIRAEIRRKGQYAKYTLEDILGNSEKMRICKEKTKQCAKFDENVLIYGESGVGKELFAQCIHNESGRSAGPFYAINCAALPESLLESELYGYSEGAFTGAKRGGKPGIFERAHTGTVFLDEVGELSPASQSALLRVIQEKEVRRIGSDTIIPVDVRIVAASNRDIYEEVEKKRFRQDLFYRLNTVFLTIPPLRERRMDIFPLLESFVVQRGRQYNLKCTAVFTEEAKRHLLNYSWMGNVRELQNFASRIFALGYYMGTIGPAEVKTLLSNSPRDEGPGTAGAYPGAKAARSVSVPEIQEALRLCGGNRTEAAKRLGISRTHLWRLLKKEEQDIELHL
ncbi:hypothetical protein C816_03750 [Oscillibacter sp. 1-3]|nr:hypothetical protein C816_03750 [Oscillibacter sp. 1-3]